MHKNEREEEVKRCRLGTKAPLTRMTIHPNCKINLGLNIIERRPDGYHNLETVFYPVPLCDALSV